MLSMRKYLSSDDDDWFSLSKANLKTIRRIQSRKEKSEIPKNVTLKRELSIIILFLFDYWSRGSLFTCNCLLFGHWIPVNDQEKAACGLNGSPAVCLWVWLVLSVWNIMMWVRSFRVRAISPMTKNHKPVREEKGKRRRKREDRKNKGET